MVVTVVSVIVLPVGGVTVIIWPGIFKAEIATSQAAAVKSKAFAPAAVEVMVPTEPLNKAPVVISYAVLTIPADGKDTTLVIAAKPVSVPVKAETSPLMARMF